MDVLFFLKKRTEFIRHFYDTACKPFHEIIRRIEAGEPPFDSPPYSEDGEPPYMEEWIQANEELEVLGRACLSMLSASLQLYFKTWEEELGMRWEQEERKLAFKNGFLQGYQLCFSKIPGLWNTSI